SVFLRTEYDAGEEHLDCDPLAEAIIIPTSRFIDLRTKDVLSKDAGECAICLEELQQGDTIARLPCLCVYHKGRARAEGAGSSQTMGRAALLSCCRLDRAGLRFSHGLLRPVKSGAMEEMLWGRCLVGFRRPLLPQQPLPLLQGHQKHNEGKAVAWVEVVFRA
ncbi:hypothetical protein U0070_008327, partial [Myodes glareolus]